MTELYPTMNADTWEEQDEDYRLSWESLVLMGKLEQMPELNTTFRVMNQYVHERHNDFCTGFAPYNAFCTIRDHEPSFEEIDEIAYTAQHNMDSPWEWPGNWRALTYGYDAVRKTLNPKYPEKAVTKWKFDVGSEVRNMLLKKRIPMWVSIIVDKAYRKDIKDWLLSGDTFNKNYWHADTLQHHHTEDCYLMLESVWGITYKVPKDIFDKLIEDKNIRAYWYCFIPSNILNMPELATNLPKHVLPSEVKDSDDKNIIVAWETEVSDRLNKWGKTEDLYGDYTGKNAIMRMVIDLKFIRKKLI